MAVVDLVYDIDCPNTKEARRQLMRAFAAAGMAPQWREWDRRAPDSPIYVRSFGSPTILVDGVDIAADGPSVATSACRVYPGPDGRLSGVPPIAAIEQALRAGSMPAPALVRRAGLLGALPAVGTALLPKLTCPLCWPAYAALLSSLGVDFIDYTPFLLPLTVVFLLVSLAALGWTAWRREAVLPFLIGLVGGVAVLTGKFVLESDLVGYAGIALLIVAALLPGRRRHAAACSQCAGDSPVEALP